MTDADRNSERRTRWAEDRTIMANERTFSGWVGTGLGCVGVALGMKAVFGAFEPVWAAKLVASLFLAIAIAIFWMARNQACRTRARLDDTDSEPQPTRTLTLIAALLTAATVATGGIIWAL